jgi:uncharacterized protein (DUF1697 family)
MTAYVALLRAINVGGTGLLPMQELAALCSELGLAKVRTYIQTGNVLFESRLAEAKLCAMLEKALAARLGKPVGVMLRSAAEMQAVLDDNPFANEPPAKVSIVFLSTPAAKTLLKDIVAPDGEQVALGTRELYIHYPNGMGRSKLKLPRALQTGTARNVNTTTKLTAMLSADD